MTDIFRANLTASLAKLEWLKPSAIEVVRIQREPSSAPASTIIKPPANSALAVKLLYYMKPDFKALQLYADVTLTLTGSSEPVFRQKYEMSTPIPAGDGDLAARWTKDNGLAMRNAFDTQLQSLANKIASDLGDPALRAAGN